MLLFSIRSSAFFIQPTFDLFIYFMKPVLQSNLLNSFIIHFSCNLFVIQFPQAYLQNSIFTFSNLSVSAKTQFQIIPTNSIKYAIENKTATTYKYQNYFK